MPSIDSLRAMALARKKKRKGRLTDGARRESMNIRDATFWTPRWSEGRNEGGMDHGWQNRPMPHSLTSLAQSPPAEFLHLKSWYISFQLGFYLLFVVCKLFGIAVISMRL